MQCQMSKKIIWYIKLSIGIKFLPALFIDFKIAPDFKYNNLYVITMENKSDVHRDRMDFRCKGYVHYRFQRYIFMILIIYICQNCELFDLYFSHFKQYLTHNHAGINGITLFS